MAFTEFEIAEHLKLLEDSFWSRRRPPLHVRDQMRDGQRFTDQAIELFFVRPAFERPGQYIEESIAKVQFVRTQSAWRIFWKRADGKWHGYKPCPEAPTLAAALRVINEDAHACFFG
jgi:hypothetical protein